MSYQLEPPRESSIEIATGTKVPERKEQKKRREGERERDEPKRTEYSTERLPNEIRPPFIPDSFIGSPISRKFPGRNPPVAFASRFVPLLLAKNASRANGTCEEKLLSSTSVYFSRIPPVPYIHIPSAIPLTSGEQVSGRQSVETLYCHKVQKNAINEKREPRTRGLEAFPAEFPPTRCDERRSAK